jgi:hypothetical protein
MATIVEPLAQSFIVDTVGGIFLTSIDLWFSARDPREPVTIDIRRIEDGVPSKKPLPFSTVTLLPTANDGTSIINVSADATSMTSFVFRAPVYLEPSSIGYCFTVSSSSTQYGLWTAIGGAPNITGNLNSTTVLSTIPPFVGAMYRSANTTNWIKEPTRAIKFRLNRARFVTNTTATATLTEGANQFRRLGANPFFTTAASNIVRVTHINHGFFAMSGTTARSKVTFSGIPSGTTLNGIPAAELNATHDIIDVEPDRYTIKVSTNASVTSNIGSLGSDGLGVVATTNKVFNTLRPVVDAITYTNTSLDWAAQTTAAKSLSGSETPNVKSSFTSINADRNTDMTSPRVVLSADNTTFIGSTKSLTLRGSMRSTVNNLSPVIDLERASVITVANRIDNPIGIIALTVSSEVASGQTTIPTSETTGLGLVVGYKVRGPGIPNNATLTTVGTDSVVISASTTAIIPQDTALTILPVETDKNAVANYSAATNGLISSPLAQYVTKKFDLNDPADSLKVILKINRPTGSNVLVYYKATSGDTNFNSASWVALPIDNPTNRQDGGIPFNDNRKVYSEVTGTIANLAAPFTSYAIKIVMTSNSSSAAPSVKDLRVVAYT